MEIYQLIYFDWEHLVFGCYACSLVAHINHFFDVGKVILWIRLCRKIFVCVYEPSNYFHEFYVPCKSMIDILAYCCRISNTNASIHDNYDGGVVSIEDDVRRSGSESLGSDVFVEGNKHDKGSASPPNLKYYSEIGLVQSSRPASDHFQLQQGANNNTLPNFSVSQLVEAFTFSLCKRSYYFN